MRKKIVMIVLMTLVGLLLAMVSPSAASPYFAIGGDQWQDALDEASVRPMTPGEWDDYLTAWQYPDTGDPYPITPFYPATLEVYQPLEEILVDSDNRADLNDDGHHDLGDVVSFAVKWLTDYTDYSYLDAPGLVMSWGPTSMAEDATSASAWVFTYGEDPDLTGTIVEIEVHPPSGITIVSFGFKDQAGKRRAWWWDAGPGKPVDGRTKLVITTDQAGNSTASPQTSNYLNEAGFQINNVLSVMADEQNTWRSARTIPPPNQAVAKAWNYWYNLLVTPIPKPDPPVYYKWRQPARYIENPTSFWGWDEVSLYHEEPLLADDWLCLDDRPVTDIHWWGSFPNKDSDVCGWKEPNLPSSSPDGFHFGIWTDSPGHRQDLSEFSHPDTMIWEYTCTDVEYDWEFVGFDRDPNDPSHPVTDSCFKFECDLPEPDYFYQDPNDGVYWLSIAAVYNDPCQVEYEWGWKTRPHYFNDDAVRITEINGPWPPTLGSQCVASEPLELPEWCSWDMAFELTTNEESTRAFP